MNGSEAQSDRREPIRVGLAGCGRLGRGVYIPAILAARRARLVAISEPDLGRRLETSIEATRLAGRPIRAHSEVSDLLSAGGVDLLVVATPPGVHADHAEAAAEAGVRTLVEKPPGGSLAGAERLAALDPQPWVGFNRRFQHSPALLDADPGPGGVLRLELRYRRSGWRPYESEADALDDLGSHLVDLALAICGGPVEATSALSTGPSRARLELRLGGRRALLACAIDRRYREIVELRDREGRRLLRLDSGGTPGAIRARLRRLESPLSRSLRGQIEAIAGALAGEPDRRLATAADGLAAMATLDAARRSAARGGSPVELDRDRDGVVPLRPATS